MTTFAHEVHHCEQCCNGYCLGCFGEKCPWCELDEYIRVLEFRVENLQFCLDACAESVLVPPILSECDIFQSELCDYYIGRDKPCSYKTSHGVKCVYEIPSSEASDSLPRKVTDE